MNKTEYMNTLRQELDGLPDTIVEEVLWHYEGLFVNAMMAGRSEEEIAATLPKPSLVAAQRRAKLRSDALKQDLRPGNLARLMVALFAVLFFNLLMVVPALIYSGLLFMAYLGGLSLYFAGIIMTAAAIAGAPQMTFYLPHGMSHLHISDHPHRHFHRDDVTVDISGDGIHIQANSNLAKTNKGAVHQGTQDDDAEVIDLHVNGVQASTTASAPAASASAASASVASASSTAALIQPPVPNKQGIPVVIGNHLGFFDALRGVGLVLGGIALFLFALFMTKMTFIGFRQYVNWNMSLLHLSEKTSAKEQ